MFFSTDVLYCLSMQGSSVSKSLLHQRLLQSLRSYVLGVVFVSRSVFPASISCFCGGCKLLNICLLL